MNLQSHNDDQTGRARFGVCGTGYWAEQVHLPALAGMPDVDLVGLWGRTSLRAQELAQTFGIRHFERFDDLLSAVDMVSFVVPPAVQADLALQAAKAGKHLLLEKPITTSLREADAIVGVVENHHLATVVFLTRLFYGGVQELIDSAKSACAAHAQATFASGALLPGSPYVESKWRHEAHGVLWDGAPHPLSVLTLTLGPIATVGAKVPHKGKVELTLEHQGGGTSTVFINHMDEGAREPTELYTFSGAGGTVNGGPFRLDRQACFREAVRCLLRQLDGRVAGPDIRFGRYIVSVLEAAQDSTTRGGVQTPVAS